MIARARRSSSRAGTRLGDAALLLFVGEERGLRRSDRRELVARLPRGRYLVGGEPTGNRFVAGIERVPASRRGDTRDRRRTPRSPAASGRGSAVEPLLDVLGEIRRSRTSRTIRFSASTTANIGVIEAGTAPNVVAERGRAEVLFRTGVADRTCARRRPAGRAAAGGAVGAVPFRADARSAFRAGSTRADRDRFLRLRPAAPARAGESRSWSAPARSSRARRRASASISRRRRGSRGDLPRARPGLLARGEEAYLEPRPAADVSKRSANLAGSPSVHSAALKLRRAEGGVGHHDRSVRRACVIALVLRWRRIRAGAHPDAGVHEGEGARR